MSGGDDVLVAVAGHGLAESRAALPCAPLADPEWDALLTDVRRQRVTGLLAAAVADGALPVTPAQRSAVSLAHQDAMGVALELEARLLRIAGVLDDAGVAWKVLKGPASAHLDYPDPSMREFGDLDLLVPGPQLPVTLASLRELGAERRVPEVSRGFDQRFAKSLEVVDPDGWEIDLHRTLALEPFGLRIDEQTLLASAEPFEVTGRRLTALATEERFLLACYHASLGNFPVRLSPLRDLAQIASGSELDLARVLGVAKRWWARAVVADAVTRAWATYALDAAAPVARWAAAYRPSRSERAALAAFQRTDRRQLHRTIATLRTTPSVSSRAIYLRSMLLPDRAYLDSRRMSVGSWWKRGQAALRAPQ